MGCSTSTPAVEVVKAESLPQWQDLEKIQVERDEKKEPYLNANFKDLIDPTKCRPFIFRQILEGNKGNSFQLETLEDALYHDLRLDPAKPGIGMKKRLEDLVYLHQERQETDDTAKDTNPVIAYSMKNVPKGLNYYLIMRSQPMYEKQQRINFTDNSPFGNMYTYAALEFDVKSKVGKIKTLFNLPNVTKGEPTFTLHQCNPKAWILKRNYTAGSQICAVFNQWKGVGMNFTCWRLAICAGEDPIFVTMIAHCIDSFLLVAKGQGWNLAPSNVPAQNLDWPPLPEGITEEQLFGREVRFWPKSG